MRCSRPSQMPPGVLAHRVDQASATNARGLAQILAVGDQAISARLETYKRRLAEKVEQAAAELNRGRVRPHAVTWEARPSAAQK